MACFEIKCYLLWSLIVMISLIMKIFSYIKNNLLFSSLFSAAILMIFITISLYVDKFGIGYWDSVEAWGQTGDFFGGILNPTFTFFSFLLLIYTISQNKKVIELSNSQLHISNQQLKISSDELAATRVEMEGSKNALQEQSIALKQQNFENTFFNLIRLYHDAVNTLEINPHGNIQKGRNCFKYLHGKLRFEFNLLNAVNLPVTMKIEKAYGEFLDKHGSQLIYPFMNIYAILRFIDDALIGNKRLYIRILMSQFSPQELALFFYHTLHSEGNIRFGGFIEKYSLLQNLDKDMLFYGNAHYDLYGSSAYKQQEI